jgi:hypothetical protein
MKTNMIANGLDPQKELSRHLHLATEYRAKLDAMGKRNNWRYRDILSSLTFHTEEAKKLRDDGVAS